MQLYASHAITSTIEQSQLYNKRFKINKKLHLPFALHGKDLLILSIHNMRPMTPSVFALGCLPVACL